jgi:hypothetical protein
MKTSEQALGRKLASRLISFDAHEHPLPGVHSQASKAAFTEQLIDSIRRVRYLAVMRSRSISPKRIDPATDFFDPLKAAVIHRQRGNLDEACWLVFLATHCGKSGKTGWRLTRDLYGSLQQGKIWNWDAVSEQPQKFATWVEKNYLILSGGDGVRRNFGNHRKYETLKPGKPKSPANVVASYVTWIGPSRRHVDLFQTAQAKTDADPRSVFNYLYRSMNGVAGFGRTGRFDYLTMLGKMGLAPVEADSAYMQGATGPLAGGRLLFKGRKEAHISVRELDSLFLRLGEHLQVGPQAMQVMEDAICNWQKSPTKFVRFTG